MIFQAKHPLVFSYQLKLGLGSSFVRAFFPLSNLLTSLDQSKEWFKLWDFPGSNLTLRGWLTGHETLVFYPPGKEKTYPNRKGKEIHRLKSAFTKGDMICWFPGGYDFLCGLLLTKDSQIAITRWDPRKPLGYVDANPDSYTMLHPLAG